MITARDISVIEAAGAVENASYLNIDPIILFLTVYDTPANICRSLLDLYFYTVNAVLRDADDNTSVKDALQTLQELISSIESMNDTTDSKLKVVMK